MEKIIYKGKDNEVADALDFIRQNAIGNAVIAEAAPTASTIKANTFVFWNNLLYVKLSNGKLYTINLTAV